MTQRCAPRPITTCVGTMTGNSGVYISSRNVVCGISRHSKSNSGFGSIGSHNLVHGNINLVYDNDSIDTPIDDRDVKIYHSESSAPKVTQVAFDSIHVVTIAQNSGVFVGDVQVTGIDSHSKQNSAQGSTYGHRNVEMQNLNYVEDTDVIDAPIQDQDFKVLSR